MPYANKADRLEAVKKNQKKKEQLGLVRFTFGGFCLPEDKEQLIKALEKAAKKYKKELSDFE